MIPTLEDDKCGICYDKLSSRYAIITEESNVAYHLKCLDEWHKRSGNRGLIKDKISTVEIYEKQNLIESRYVVEYKPVVIQQAEANPLIVVNRPARFKKYKIPLIALSSFLFPLILFIVAIIPNVR